MSKTIVSILSGQLLPNFLVIKDYYKPEQDDKLIFITTGQTRKSKGIDIMISTLNLKREGYTEIPLSDEENWDKMQNEFKNHFNSGTEYLVNFTGGTKYMALALYDFFEKQKDIKAEYIYIPWPKNHTLNFTNQKIIDIKHRINIDVYLKLCNIDIKKNDSFLFEDEQDYSKEFFSKFIEFKPNGYEFEAISNIRDCLKQGGGGWNSIKDDPKVEKFLEKNFKLKKDDINKRNREKKEKCLKYLRGDWFEEYTRQRLSDAFRKLISITAGNIPSNQDHPQFEIDCIFTLNNKCFIIECKTVLESDWLKETIYRAGTINKSVIGALSAKSYVFYINKQTVLDDKTKEVNVKVLFDDRKVEITRVLDDKTKEVNVKETKSKHQSIDTLIERAKTLKIKFFGKEYFTESEKFTELIDTIKKDAGLEDNKTSAPSADESPKKGNEC